MYKLKITTNGQQTLYVVKDNEDKTIISSFNKDTFILKAKYYLTKKQLKEVK